MHEMILFGDIHTDPACYQLITELLPELKREGYESVYMESGERDIKAIIRNLDFEIERLEAFPDGVIPEKMNPQQEQVLAQYRCDRKSAVSSIKGIIENSARTLEWCKAKKRMVEVAITLGIQIICVDVHNVLDYRKLGGNGERSQLMFDNIKLNLPKGKDSKSIVITGFSHLIDNWEETTEGRDYKQGIIRLVIQEQATMWINNCFLPYSIDGEVMQAARKCINLCADIIMELIRLVDLRGIYNPPLIATSSTGEATGTSQTSSAGINIGSNLSMLPSTLSALPQKPTVLSLKKKDSVSSYTCVICNQDNNLQQQSINALGMYIMALGCDQQDIQFANSGGKASFNFKINSSALDHEDKRNLLDIERVSHQAVLSEIQITSLKTDFPYLTVEPTSNGLLFTFPKSEVGIKDRISDEVMLSERARENTRLAALVAPSISGAINSGGGNTELQQELIEEPTLLPSLQPSSPSPTG